MRWSKGVEYLVRLCSGVRVSAKPCVPGVCLQRVRGVEQEATCQPGFQRLSNPDPSHPRTENLRHQRRERNPQRVAGRICFVAKKCALYIQYSCGRLEDYLFTFSTEDCLYSVKIQTA